MTINVLITVLIVVKFEYVIFVAAHNQLTTIFKVKFYSTSTVFLFDT